MMSRTRENETQLRPAGENLAAEAFLLHASGAGDKQISAALNVAPEDAARMVSIESQRRREAKKLRDRCKEQPLCRRRHGLDVLLDFVPSCRIEKTKE